MARISKVFLITVVLALTGCASLPNSPDVMVLPGAGSSFEHFRNDDTLCEQYAYSQVGGTTANDAAASSEELQQHYDVAYIQCMYAKGHQVPISGQFSGVIPHATVAPTLHIPPPPPSGIPPAPPPGSPSASHK
ncbi:MAG: hypothetical protein PHY16_01100 [Methylobacter sp.]|nr:hypothetical protein [Methylobacter sp.]